MKKIGKVSLVVFLIALLALAGCSQGNGGKDDEKVPTARILTGPPGLTVHTVGSTLSEYIKDSLVLTVEPGSTNGNAMSVNNKEAEFGISMTTAVVNGFNGKEFYADKGKLENIRVIATLWHHYILPVTTNKDLKHIDQLKGAKLTAGPPGGDSEPLVKKYLSYTGLTEDDYTIIPFGFQEGAEALKNRQIDLLFSGAPFPNPLQEDIGKTQGGRYINAGKENAERLAKEYDGLYLVEFKEGAQGLELDKPYYTVSYKAVLITHVDVPEETVYTITKGLYDNYTRMGDAVGNMRTFPIEELMTDVGGVPYHDGALKFYNEVGLAE
ncbi:MAG: TAXI family TRAP transporter solute-binding subunit [Firmicutes bacterium]|nr:TAXI family TRAP transporter solute-binding subunit [Bacillota bacterium]